MNDQESYLVNLIKHYEFPVHHRVGNECIFKFAQLIKSMPGIEKTTEKEKETFLSIWYAEFKDKIRDKDGQLMEWEEVLLHYSTCYDKVKFRAGGALMDAKEFGQKNVTPEAKNFESEKIRILIGACYFLSEKAEDGVFFLSGKAAGAFVDKNQTWGFGMLGGLVAKNVLSLVQKGNRAKASSYRYVLQDPDPDLTEEIIQKYRNLINSPDFNITEEQKNKFIQTTIRMTKFFSKGKGRIIKTAWVDFLMQSMRIHLMDKGQLVNPGNLCNDHTWGIIMPHHLKDLGTWYE